MNEKLPFCYVLIVILFALQANGQSTNPAPYCYAGYDDDSIAFPFAFNNIHIVGNTQNLNVSTGLIPAPHYLFHNNLLPAVDFRPGDTYLIEYRIDTIAGVNQYASMYIDYDQSGTIDAAEWTDLGREIGSGLHSVSFTVPADACPGTTRMRLMLENDHRYLSQPNILDGACTVSGNDTIDWGSTEDFTVEILPGPSGSVPHCALTGMEPVVIMPAISWNSIDGNLEINSEASKILTATVCDLLGRCLYFTSETAFNIHIPINSLNQPILLLRIETEKGMFIRKVVSEPIR